jgi:ubiquinone/menaquinone biosynthesis C-methylase UbiE
MLERLNLLRLIGRGLCHPGRAVAHFRRRWRNARIGSQVADPVDFYRRVVNDEARKDPDRAVGSDSSENWLAVGKLQFDYLIRHGLKPTDRLLELGCGNLRLGWRLISYLEPGNYFGLDISPVILMAALERIAELGLQSKLPRFYLVRGTSYDFLPESSMDIVQAHSVFTHSRFEVIERILASVWRVMKPGSFFDFTYSAADHEACDALGEHFRYPARMLLDAVERCGFVGRPMDDWDYVQDKIRALKP